LTIPKSKDPPNHHFSGATPPKTNISPENQFLEDEIVLLKNGSLFFGYPFLHFQIFQGAMPAIFWPGRMLRGRNSSMRQEKEMKFHVKGVFFLYVTKAKEPY